MSSYLRPTGLADALAALSEGGRTVLAGGTDYFAARAGRPLDGRILDVTAIEGLRAIADEGDRWRIGALATWTDVLRADLPDWLRGLQLAAREVGGVQVQNSGTVAGNLCNASPAADGVPCLMALDARVLLASAGGERSLAVPEFVLGSRRTALRPDEMVVGILVPRPAPGASSAFFKLGARRYLVISIAMAAAVLERAADGTGGRRRVAGGAGSEGARRLRALEDAAAGRPADARLAELVDAERLGGLAPIDDVRASAEYRRDAAATVVRRALLDLVRGEAG